MSRPTTPSQIPYTASTGMESDSAHRSRPATATSKRNSYHDASMSGASGIPHGAPLETSLLADMHHNEHEAVDASPVAEAPKEDLVSQTNPPVRGGTLKKKSSLKKSGSVKRSMSRRSSHAGSVRSVALGEKEKYQQSSEQNSAFYCPVPTHGNPTDLLANRFQAWRKVLKDLITYFRDVQKSYETRVKALHSASNILSNTTVPPEFLSSGGLGESLHILQDFYKGSLNELTKARDIENEIVLQLTGLRSDLQQKIKEIKGLSGDFKNNVDRELEGTKRVVRTLQEAVGMVDRDSGGATGKGDPFIVKMGVDRQVERQIEEENYLHRAYLNLEASGRELESIVVGEIQKAYNAYATILRRVADENYEAAEKLKEGPLSMAKDHEWGSFTSSNKQMIDPRIPVRSLASITYPGKDHPAVIEVKSGMLERKSKYLKNYTPGWYILSPTHLHEFKSADRIASQTPVMSLFLPEQKLGSHSEPGSNSHKFMLKGRQTGSMHRSGHSWVFRAESHDTMMAWFSDLKELTEKTGEQRNEFVRRTHARSMSGNSLKPASVASSDGGMEEDEADHVPYSSEQSVRGASVPRGGESAIGAVVVDGLGVSTGEDMEDKRSEAGWRPPQERPSPGGRFPSEIDVNRGLQAPHSPSSAYSTDRDVMAAAALPGSGVPFDTHEGEGVEQPYPHHQQVSGNESAGPTESAVSAIVPGMSDTDYGIGAHPNSLPHDEGAAVEQTAHEAAWAPMAAASGAVFGVVGAGEYAKHHEEKKEEEHLPMTEGQPSENVENVEHQMENSSAVPAHGTSSAPIPVDDTAVSEAETSERTPSRARGLTDSTTAHTTASTMPAESMADTDLTVSTVATSVGGFANDTTPATGYTDNSNGAIQKDMGNGTIQKDMMSSTVGKETISSVVPKDPVSNTVPTDIGIEPVVTGMGSSGTDMVKRPEYHSAHSVNTISDLHVPGEFPKPR